MPCQFESGQRYQIMKYYKIIPTSAKQWFNINFYSGSFLQEFQNFCILINYNPWTNWNLSHKNSENFYDFRIYNFDYPGSRLTGGFDSEGIKRLEQFAELYK